MLFFVRLLLGFLWVLGMGAVRFLVFLRLVVFLRVSYGDVIFNVVGVFVGGLFVIREERGGEGSYVVSSGRFGFVVD